MSEIENRKIQDVLREVADGCPSGPTIRATVRLGEALGVGQTDDKTYGEVLAACLREIADRVDRQGVVEVLVPGAPCEEAGRLAQKLRVIAEDEGWTLKAIIQKALGDWLANLSDSEVARRLADRIDGLRVPLDDPYEEIERRHTLNAGSVRWAVSRLALGESTDPDSPDNAERVLALTHGMTTGEVRARLACNVAAIPLLGDGAACRLGDEVEAEVNPGEWERGTLDGIGRDGDVLVAMSERGSYWLAPDKVRRAVRLRTIDDILAEAEDAGCDDEPERILALVREAYELGRGERDE